MIISGKYIERSNVVCVFSNNQLVDIQQLLPCYSEEQRRGSNFADDHIMRVRVLDLPALGLKWIAEPGRLRLEEERAREPMDSKIAKEMHRVIFCIFGSEKPSAYGFNFDVVYRASQVIPQQDILRCFIKTDDQELVKDFGWQYTLAREKGKWSETYFFKVISPIEISMHVNNHFVGGGFPTEEEIQATFEKCYSDIDAVFSTLSF
jgi:hypothetical protein